MGKFSLDFDLIPNEELTRHCLSCKYFKNYFTEVGYLTWCFKDGTRKETECLYGNCEYFVEDD